MLPYHFLLLQLEYSYLRIYEPLKCVSQGHRLRQQSSILLKIQIFHPLVSLLHDEGGSHSLPNPVKFPHKILPNSQLKFHKTLFHAVYWI